MITLTREKYSILCNDVDAHKKKRESLSPDNKNLFDRYNAAALNKHCKTLTPDQKAQELEKNAAGQKNIENLSLLNKKVKLNQSMQLYCFPQRQKQDMWK
jgi:hypothetical protein